MTKLIALVLFSVFTLAGCASTMPMQGGMLDDHAETLTKCGVGNYTFYHLKETCGSPAAPVAAATETKSAPAATPTQVSSIAKMTDSKIEISKQVTFATGSAKLTPQGMQVLDEVAKVIEANRSTISKIDIEGHTDHTGNPDKNMTLSEARANSVKAYLGKKGIDSGKLSAKGYGQTKPKYEPSTATKSQTAENRRVEFNVETTRN